jgi:hypothetical protein
MIKQVVVRGTAFESTSFPTQVPLCCCIGQLPNCERTVILQEMLERSDVNLA